MEMDSAKTWEISTRARQIMIEIDAKLHELVDAEDWSEDEAFSAKLTIAQCLAGIVIFNAFGVHGNPSEATQKRRAEKLTTEIGDYLRRKASDFVREILSESKSNEN